MTGKAQAREGGLAGEAGRSVRKLTLNTDCFRGCPLSKSRRPESLSGISEVCRKGQIHLSKAVMNNRISPVGGGVAGVAVAAAVVAAEPVTGLLLMLFPRGVLAFRVFNPPADAAGLFNPV